MLGVAGLVGSRRTELLNALFGYYTKGGGGITMNGAPISNVTTDEARKNGFALITEERRATGIFGENTILFNSIIANVDNYGKPLLNNTSKLMCSYGGVLQVTFTPALTVQTP